MKEDDLKQAPLAIQRLGDRKKLWYHIRLLQCEQNEFYSLFNTQIVQENQSLNNSCSMSEEDRTIFKTLKGEERKTLVSFFYAFISGVWTSFIMVVVHNRVPNVQK